jgi:hypothetical protein
MNYVCVCLQPAVSEGRKGGTNQKEEQIREDKLEGRKEEGGVVLI